MQIKTSNGIANVSVGKLDINLLDSTSVDNALKRNDITSEEKEKIKQRQQQAIQAGSKSAMVTLFSPELLASLTNTKSMATTTSSSSSTYYTYTC
jgi:hypothetical protein